MSLQANPLLYLNMGGEMLYVLRQRLKAQKIAIDKSVQVLDEVSASLLNTEIVSKFFQHPVAIDLPEIRSSLEDAVLSSIMRLDETSMSKLFDLMIMMVKFQIKMATGPRELLLLTLNHVDSMRDMLLDSSGQQSLNIVHRMLLQLYGNLTYEEMWQIREACLLSLHNYNVRVSILLKLGLQLEDGTFVSPKMRIYDENYTERREDLWNLRILENSCQGCNIGSLQLIGNRVTILGTNIYSSFYGIHDKIDKKLSNDKKIIRKLRLSNSGADSRAELGMLAKQLGNSEESSDDLASSLQYQSRPFTLQLFTENFQSDDKKEDENNQIETGNLEDNQIRDVKVNSNHLYRAKLDNIYSDFIVEEEKETNITKGMELLDLMDQLQ